MLKIALTGSIASGKTSILGFFERHGIATIDADAIVSNLYQEPKVRAAIFEMFKTMDRKEIASIVFSSAERRLALESLLHPIVVKEIRRRMGQLKEQGKPLVVVELPLLFEAGLENLFDRVIAVNTSKKEQLVRLKKLGFSGSEALQRIESQLSSGEKVKKSDFVIDNNSSLRSAFAQAEKILGKLNG